MKRFTMALSLLLVCLIFLVLGTNQRVFGEEGPDTRPISGGGGMPGYPVPARPIPHHEPGHPARGMDYSTQVERINAQGVEETVQLTGLDAMLADGTVTDPLQGNYRLVGLDKVMFGAYNWDADPNDFSVQSFRWVTPTATPTLELIPDSTLSFGDMRFTDIAAGDLNGDFVDEQIVAWVDRADNHIYMQVGELPGSFGKTTSAPAVVAHPDGSLDVVARGYDQALWRQHYDGAHWGNWDNGAGGLLLSAPALASRASGELDVFAVGVDNQVYQAHWADSKWNDWELVDGDGHFPANERNVPLPEVPAPAVTARGGAQLDLFRLGPDNTLWWRSSADGDTWGAWQNLGGMLASGPGAVSLGDGRMEVYALGMDGALWYRTYSGGWGDWKRLATPDGVAGNAVPVLTSPAAGEVAVYLAGTESRIWSIQHAGTSWGSWSSTEVEMGKIELGLGIGAAAGPSGTHLFAQMSDGSLQYSLNDSDWAPLTGLDVSQRFDTGAVTKALPGDDALENAIFDITTGYFTGDGRQQVVLAYADADNILRLEVYDIHNGFALTRTAQLPPYITPGRTFPRVATGDVDGDGVDEIGLVNEVPPSPNVPDSSDSWEIRVLKIEEDSGNWTLGEVDYVWLAGPSNYVFGGTLRIAAGDIVPDTPSKPTDEFAVVVDWYHVDTDNSPWLYQMSAGLWLYDYDKYPANVANRFFEGAYPFYENAHATGIGLAVGDVDGPQSGYGIDEIVVTWPRENFQSFIFPAMVRDVVVCGVKDDGTFGCPDSYQIPGFSWYSYLDTVAVGDLDQDLMDEIVLAAGTYGQGFDLYVYEFETLNTGPVSHYDLPYTENFIPRAFNLAMGDFTGESVRVGPPSYRRQHDVGQVIAVVNAPPKHKDVVDSIEYNLNADDADTYSQFEQVTGTSTEVSVTTHKDWGVSSEFKSTIGDPDASHVSTSIENSYGENFENTGSSTQSLTYQQSIKAITDDVLYYTRLDYDVWEYPVYDSLTYAPQGSMSVVWPVGGMQSVVEPANTCDGWYKPNHQLMNVWSYPSTADQLLDRNESADLYNAPLYTIGTEQVDFSVDFSNVSMESRSHEYELGFAGSFESQIGGEEVGVNLGVVSFSTRLPSLYFSTSGEYNQSELAEWQTETTETTSLSGYFNPIPEGIDYRYAVQPYLYWSDSDYLVLDYVTDPSDQAFWSPSGDKYNRPDPAFIRPWAEGQCNHLWPDAEYITSDITIDPPMAKAGEPVTITATLRNFSEVGNGSAPFNQPFKVSFYQGDPDAGGSLIGQQTIAVGDLKPRTEKAVITRSIQWVSEGSGEQHIYAVIDPEDALLEVHDENDPGVNNNKGYAVLSMNTIDFVDAGQAVEKAYHAVTLALGDPAPISTLFVPLGTFADTMRIDMQTAAEFAGLHSLGSPFEIIPYQTNWENPEPDFTFTPVEGDDPPAVISLDYAGADLTGFDENRLTLYRYTGSGWVEATCPGYAIERFSEDNLIAVPVCQTGIFALSDKTPTPLDQKFYLPLVLE